MMLPVLETILSETLELAELRAVDEDALRGTGQFLPVAYFATNSAGAFANVPVGSVRW